MFDSDTDSWYDWKRGNDINEMHAGHNAEARNSVRMIGSDRSKNFASDDGQRRTSRSNGMIRCDTIPTSSRRSSTEVRFINPAIYAETLNDQDLEHGDDVRVKVGTKNDGLVLANCGDSAEMSDRMSSMSINNDLGASYMDYAGDQGSAQETYRCYSLNSPGASASAQSGIMRSKSVISYPERRCRVTESADDSKERCCNTQIDPEMERYTRYSLKNRINHRISFLFVSPIIFPVPFFSSSFLNKQVRV